MAGPDEQTTSRNWREIVTALYPDALKTTYVVPPVHFNKVPYVEKTAPGTSETIFVLHPPSVYDGPPTSGDQSTKPKQDPKQKRAAKSTQESTSEEKATGKSESAQASKLTENATGKSESTQASKLTENATGKSESAQASKPDVEEKATGKSESAQASKPDVEENATGKSESAQASKPDVEEKATGKSESTQASKLTENAAGKPGSAQASKLTENATGKSEFTQASKPDAEEKVTGKSESTRASKPEFKGAELSEPTQTAKPTQASIQTETPKPTQNSKLTQAHEPTLTSRSTVKDTETSETTQTSRETSQHKQSLKPTPASNGTETAEPTQDSNPKQAKEPTKTAKPTQTSELAETPKPTANPQQKQTTKPSQTIPSKKAPKATDASPPTQTSRASRSQGIKVTVRECDVQADFTQQHLLYNLQELGTRRHEVMFVLSELNFKDYLNKPFYAKQTSKLPKPSNIPAKDRHHGKQGDFDVLLIHRQYGILVGEVKSVGKTQASQDDVEVIRVLQKAVKQLDKCEVHARHMVSDIASELTVRKTLFLPYVSSSQLRRVLSASQQLKEAICRSLGATTAEEAVQLVCCSDMMSHVATFWDVTPSVLANLSTWWKLRMACTVDTQLTDELYLDIVSRFVGPATSVNVHCNIPPRVEVRTKGEAVSELGRRLALLVLTLQQLDLLNRAPPRVCITGPAGTGKTVVLVLMGLRWLLQGRDVHLVSSSTSTPAISYYTRQQLEETLKQDPNLSASTGRVYGYRYDFFGENDNSVEHAVQNLLRNMRDQTLCVLIDEASFPFTGRKDSSGPRFHRLVKELTKRVPHLYICVATSFSLNIPSELQKEELTVPIRFAPSVFREVNKVKQYAHVHVPDALPYSDITVPSPGDGMSMICLGHRGMAHKARWPENCVQCGLDIAAVLRRLGVGSKETPELNSPEPLKYTDVLVLTRGSDLHEEFYDPASRSVTRASGIARGLRKAGLPVRVLGDNDFYTDRERYETETYEMALDSTDKVTVSHWGRVYGLERKIVVWLPGRAKFLDQGDRDLLSIELSDRAHLLSRCTTQLIRVEVDLVTYLYNDGGDDDDDDDDDRDVIADKASTNDVSWARKGFLTGRSREGKRNCGEKSSERGNLHSQENKGGTSHSAAASSCRTGRSVPVKASRGRHRSYSAPYSRLPKRHLSWLLSFGRHKSHENLVSGTDLGLAEDEKKREAEAQAAGVSYSSQKSSPEFGHPPNSGSGSQGKTPVKASKSPRVKGKHENNDVSWFTQKGCLLLDKNPSSGGIQTKTTAKASNSSGEKVKQKDNDVSWFTQKGCLQKKTAESARKPSDKEDSTNGRRGNTPSGISRHKKTSEAARKDTDKDDDKKKGNHEISDNRDYDRKRGSSAVGTLSNESSTKSAGTQEPKNTAGIGWCTRKGFLL